MSSSDKQGSSLGSFPTSPPLYPHFNRPSGFLTLCQVVSGGRQRQILGELSPRTVLFMIMLSWRRGVSQLSFLNVLFSFNIFLITHFRVVLSFEPFLDHNRNQTILWWDFNVAGTVRNTEYPFITIVLGTYLWIKKNCLTFKPCAIKWVTQNWIAWNRTAWSLNCV